MHEIDGYRLERRLGAGGFATVWLGYDERLDGHVAVKILADNWTGDADVTRRFVEEARFMWRADDPRIVRVLTVGELDNGQPYFVMEYADRGTLKSRIADGLLDSESLTLEERVGLVSEIAACIEAVHESGAIHRDVKPDNFLIRSGRRRDQSPIPGLADDERLLIADLGLAKNVVAASGVSIAAGSPGYMAPEQADIDGRVDHRVDVFALGVVAFEVIAGERPFAQGRFNVTALLESVDDIPLVSAVAPTTPTAFDAVLRKAMHPQVEQRYNDVASFVADLRAALDGDPAAPTPPSADAATRLVAPPSTSIPATPPAPTSPPAPATPPAPTSVVAQPVSAASTSAPSPSTTDSERGPATASTGASGISTAAKLAIVAAVVVAGIVAVLIATNGDGNENPDTATNTTDTADNNTAAVTNDLSDGQEPQGQAGGGPGPLLVGGEIRLPPGATLNRVRSSDISSVFNVEQSALQPVVRGLETQLVAAGFTIQNSTCCALSETVDVRAEREGVNGDSTVFVAIGEASRSEGRFTFLWSES